MASKIGDAEELGLAMPRAKVTLKVADESDRTMWVTECAEEVVERVRDAAAGKHTRWTVAGLVELTRVKAMKGEPFFTRFDNVANIEGMGE